MNRPLRLLAGVAATVMAAAVVWRLTRTGGDPPEPLAVIFTSVEGMDPVAAAGLKLYVEDHLQALGSWPILQPGAREGAVPRLELAVTRTESGLALRGRVVHREGDRPVAVEGPDPVQVIHRGLAPLLGPHGPDALDPGPPEAFWEVLPLLAAPLERAEPALQEALPRAVRLRETHPSATAWLAEAHLRFRLLVAQAAVAEEAHGRCDQAFREALQRQPDYPRLVLLYANYRTDVGDQKGALDMLFKALRSHPRMASLHNAVAYAARTSGLLDGAVRAVRRREALGGEVNEGYFLVENTLLYRGQWETFEQSLLKLPGQDPVTAFYLGYVRLLQGRPGAEAAFRQAQGGTSGLMAFRVLSAIYLEALAGRREDALARLRRLDEERARVRVPDGEFTFKLAEAYAFLGEDRAAFEVAQRAFGQGFACTEWYERAPFLARLHGWPAWEGLLAALRERQRRMEARFPADRFGK